MQAAQAHDLITELRAPETGDLRSDVIREQLIKEHQGLVHHFIRVHDPDLREELAQLGNIGLFQAIEKYDLDRDIAFSTFAGTQIKGEISHFLRDRRHTIRIPRSLQVNYRKTLAAIDQLTAELQRSPTVRELSTATGLDTAAILDALESAHTYDMTSLSEPDSWDWPSDSDAGFDSAEARAVLIPALELLSDQDRQLIGMRFIQGLSQSAIAERTGMHQVAVGRRITQILEELRRDTGELL